MIVVSVLLLRNQDRKILLQFRDSNASSTKLGWSFFGGRGEVDESPIEVLVREIHEELDINIQEEDVLLLAKRDWISPNTGTKKIVYLYEYIKPINWGDFQVCEGAGAAFLTKDEILSLENLSPLAQALILEFC